jgi:hypothetical protein
VNGDQPCRRLARHRVRDGGADVTALGHVACVAETAHELCPGALGATGVPADFRRLSREAVTLPRGMAVGSWERYQISEPSSRVR